MTSSPSPQRLLSLDVFRGLTIAAMVLVNSPGNEYAYAPLKHAEWNGCTFTDVVFPFFLFAVGISLVFSLTKRLGHESTPSLLKKVLIRCAILFALGLFLSGFPKYDFGTIRVLGVLQRIALCYLAGAVVFLITRSFWSTLSWVSVLLVGYWIAMTAIPVPGYGAGDLGMEGNLAAYLDRLLLAGHTYKPVYDPEGLLSTLPAIATTLLGNLTGLWLLAERSEAEKVGRLFGAGLVTAALGWTWGYSFPMNKSLWTSSYVLWTAGLAMMVLAILYDLLERRGWRRWGKPFEWFGANAILIYVGHILFLKIQNRIPMARLDGSAGNLRLYLSEHLFGWTNAYNASLFYAISYTLLWLVLAYVLYRKRIFLKV